MAIDALIPAGWEDHPPPKASASLHGYIADVRKLLGAAELDPKAVLATAPPGYLLSVADEQCDVGRFQALQAAGVQASADGRFEQARAHLAAALDEWKGPALADLRDYEFARVFAAALDRDRLSTITARAEAEIACGRAHGVLSELQALTGEHPYEEPLWAQFITALYLTGRQADALGACRRLATILDEDLGITPGSAIRDLEQRILRQESFDVGKAVKITATGALGRITRSSPGSARPVTATLHELENDTRHKIKSRLTRIGRDDENDIVLPYGEVSRRHAVIVNTGASSMIVDLHSRNGIHVDGERVKINATLTNGARVGFGGHEFVFEIEAGGGDHRAVDQTR